MANSTIYSVFSKMFPAVGKDSSPLARQQMISFILYTLTLIASLAVNLVGLAGPQSGLSIVLNWIFLAVSLLLLLVYKLGAISMRNTFCMMTIVVQLFTCNEMLLCTMSHSEYNVMLIVGNMVLLVANVMFSIIGQLRYTPYILCAISVLTYMACVVITGNSILANFATLYVVIFSAVAILSNLLVRNIQYLNNENTGLKHTEKEILGLLNMKKGHVMALAKLSKLRHEAIETRNLLALLGEEARNNVIANVKQAMMDMDMERKSMTEIFPELSPSEIEICRLIIMDKSLNEVCATLGKSESNITCQRSNIRKKLGLQPSDNLKQVLQARFNGAKIA